MGRSLSYENILASQIVVKLSTTRNTPVERPNKQKQRKNLRLQFGFPSLYLTPLSNEPPYFLE